MTTASYNRRFTGTGAENYQPTPPGHATTLSAPRLCRRTAALHPRRPRARRRLWHWPHCPPRGGTGRTNWFGDGHRRRALMIDVATAVPANSQICTGM